MANWLNGLEPEFYIILGLFLVIIIFIVLLLVLLLRVNERISSQDFEILESIAEQEKKYFYHITVVNKSLSPNFINHIGFNRGNVRHVLDDKNNPIPPRNKYSTKFPMEDILEITNLNVKKFKKVTLFAENEIGLRKKTKPKQLNKFLKREFRKTRRLEAKAKKLERMETGNYNIGERIFLVLKLFFRPFYKLHQKIKFSTNKVLKESEIRRIQKSEHDKIELRLNETAAKVNEMRVKEETYRENRTRETELELLKQQKAYEIESLKQSELNKAFEKQKAKISAINVKEEVKKYFEKQPITLNEEKVKVKTVIEEDNSAAILDLVPTNGKDLTTEVDYQDLKLSELKEIAKERNIVGYSSLKKAELIDVLQENKDI